MIFKYSSLLYPKEVIIKTAYMFTNDCFVHLDLVDNNYMITITSKNNEDDSSLQNRLNNEIIVQLTQYIVSEKTSEIRKLLMGRAFASSYINNNTDMPEYNENYIASANEILKDWFDNNE